jgi:hypothetical protein
VSIPRAHCSVPGYAYLGIRVQKKESRANTSNSKCVRYWVPVTILGPQYLMSGDEGENHCPVRVLIGAIFAPADFSTHGNEFEKTQPI